ncbi:heterokaryon incompatibility protein-domain-containing protein [Cadophora sp. MPI-SDFR-AT-0126]|nr:heterokaryon incompatibility protein-domain-containing protein [Leotiomycetes sp. MPI-SDFR-AT-0126]
MVLVFGLAPISYIVLGCLRYLQNITGLKIPGFPPAPVNGVRGFFKGFFTPDLPVEDPAHLPDDRLSQVRLGISSIYEYEPLDISEEDNFQIRVLELLPASDICDPVQFKLHRVSFDATPDYEALSYCWGESLDTWPIYHGDNIFHARINLVQALQRFRLDDESRFLWVDAICIDQSSSAERSHQVSKMDRIYQRSKCTLIWLGCGDTSTVRGLDCVQILLNIKDHLEKNDPEKISPQALTKYKIASMENPVMRAFLTLQSNPWFTRIWIIQEVAMASQATITLGASTVKWMDFFNAREIAAKIGILTMAVDDICNGPFSISMARFIVENRHKLGPEEDALLPLLLRHRKFGATDPRDKIFGLYGLFPPSKYCRPLLLRPNYESSIVELYSKVAKCILDQEQNLNILGVPRSSSPATTAFLDKALQIPGWAFSDPPRLPSWAPTWYTDVDIVPLRPELLYYEKCTFEASGSTKYEMRLSPDHALLGVDGYRICDITTLGAIWPANIRIKHLLEDTTLTSWDVASSHQKMQIAHTDHQLSTLNNWQKLAVQNPKQKYPFSDSNETYFEAFWQTMLAGHILEETGKAQYRHSFLAWQRDMRHFERFKKLWFCFPIFAVSTLRIRQIFILSLIIQWFMPNPNGLLFLSGTALAIGRRIVRTEEGYLALVPGGTESGDRVFLLKGGRVPVVLRRRGEMWEVVGEAYVHGVMRGEAWDEGRCEEMWLE